MTHTHPAELTAEQIAAMKTTELLHIIETTCVSLAQLRAIRAEIKSRTI